MKRYKKLTYRGYEITIDLNPYKRWNGFVITHPDGEGDCDTAESLQEAKELIDTGLMDNGNMYLRCALEYDYEREQYFISND